MTGDLCTVPRIVSLPPLSLETDVIDPTLGASGLWLGTRRGTGGTATLTMLQPMAQWTVGRYRDPEVSLRLLYLRFSYTSLCPVLFS